MKCSKQTTTYPFEDYKKRPIRASAENAEGRQATIRELYMAHIKRNYFGMSCCLKRLLQPLDRHTDFLKSARTTIFERWSNDGATYQMSEWFMICSITKLIKLRHRQLYRQVYHQSVSWRFTTIATTWNSRSFGKAESNQALSGFMRDNKSTKRFYGLDKDQISCGF